MLHFIFNVGDTCMKGTKETDTSHLVTYFRLEFIRAKTDSVYIHNSAFFGNMITALAALYYPSIKITKMQLFFFIRHYPVFENMPTNTGQPVAENTVHIILPVYVSQSIIPSMYHTVFELDLIKTFPENSYGREVRCGSPPTLSIVFRHPPPNPARIAYATEGALFISVQLSTDAASTL